MDLGDGLADLLLTLVCVCGVLYLCVCVCVCVCVGGGGGGGGGLAQGNLAGRPVPLKCSSALLAVLSVNFLPDHLFWGRERKPLYLIGNEDYRSM